MSIIMIFLSAIGLITILWFFFTIILDWFQSFIRNNSTVDSYDFKQIQARLNALESRFDRPYLTNENTTFEEWIRITINNETHNRENLEKILKNKRRGKKK